MAHSCYSTCLLCADLPRPKRCEVKHKAPPLPSTRHQHSAGGLAGHYWTDGK